MFFYKNSRIKAFVCGSLLVSSLGLATTEFSDEAANSQDEKNQAEEPAGKNKDESAEEGRNLVVCAPIYFGPFMDSICFHLSSSDNIHPSQKGSFKYRDVEEKETEYQIELRLPDFEESDISVNVSQHGVSISANRTIINDIDDDNGRRVERSNRSYHRNFSLQNIDSNSFEKTFANGVLIVKIKKMMPEKTSPQTGEQA